MRTQSTVSKLIVRTPDRVETKIEVNPVLRGCVYEPQSKVVSPAVEDQFGFAEMTVLSDADLYAGKITAALDRQHPRDLFDVHLLMRERLNEALRTALVVYLISHDRPMPSLLLSANRDIRRDYANDFRGMTDEEVGLETLLAARTALIDDVIANMPEDHKRFLVSFYKREPEWERLGVTGLDQLPSVRWREINLDKAGKETRDHIVSELERILRS